MKARAFVALGLMAIACRSSSSEQPQPVRPSVPPIEAPPELASIRQQALLEATRLVDAAEKLEAAVVARDLATARRRTLEFRRAYRRIEPLACVLAPVGSSQLEVGDDDDGTGEQPTGVGLFALGDLLGSDPVDFEKARTAAGHALRSSRLVQTELGAARFHAHAVGQGLSRSVFVWGRRLDGSRALSDQESKVDNEASGASLVQLSKAFAAALPKSRADLRRRFLEATKKFESYLDGSKPGRKLDALLSSGELGAEIRAATVALGGSAKPPFFPRHRTRDAAFEEPVSVATFPAWLASAPDVEKVQLGSALFFDKRLSQNEKMSCSTCHDVRLGLSSGGKRPLKVNGTRLTRDVPSLYNSGFEPMLFWDGRASTLSEQAGIAIRDDMAGDFGVIVGRLLLDRDLAERFRKAFPEGISETTVRAALQEFERTLVSDETPFDRYVRGDSSALDAEQKLGFDVFFGKARCSFCHRLPLTSGALPPRFKRTPVNVIGVPVAPKTKKLDVDLGRGAITQKPADRAAFKTPSLRNLALTAPYFHNGAFRTLGEVVDFYEKGSGAGLGIDVAIDPDARPFELDAHERKALLAFLERGLRDAIVAPESTRKSE